MSAVTGTTAHLCGQTTILLQAGEKNANSSLVLGVHLVPRLQLSCEQGISLHSLRLQGRCADHLVSVVV